MKEKKMEMKRRKREEEMEEREERICKKRYGKTAPKKTRLAVSSGGEGQKRTEDDGRCDWRGETGKRGKEKRGKEKDLPVGKMLPSRSRFRDLGPGREV
jgi:hypothetical protein